jgi:hypothetical protein
MGGNVFHTDTASNVDIVRWPWATSVFGLE